MRRIFVLLTFLLSISTLVHSDTPSQVSESQLLSLLHDNLSNTSFYVGTRHHVDTWIQNQPSIVQKSGAVVPWIVSKEVELNWKINTDITSTEQYCLDTYRNLLEDGVAPEMARMILPQTMYTEWIWSGSLDAFADMCKLRCKRDTQYETQIIANDIDERMRSLFPHSWNALRRS